MKHYLLAGLLLAAVPTLAQTAPPAGQEAGTTQALDAKGGFRQYKLGAPMADYPNLKRKGKLGYYAPDESLKIGDFNISDLNFLEYKGLLYSVKFMATGLVNVQGIVSTLATQYGEGEDAGRGMRAWKGKNVTMYCQTGGSTLYPVCIIIMLSTELIAKEKAEGDKVVKKATNDL